jgi:hypothetical protein
VTRCRLHGAVALGWPIGWTPSWAFFAVGSSLGASGPVGLAACSSGTSSLSWHGAFRWPSRRRCRWRPERAAGGGVREVLREVAEFIERPIGTQFLDADIATGGGRYPRERATIGAA